MQLQDQYEISAIQCDVVVKVLYIERKASLLESAGQCAGLRPYMLPHINLTHPKHIVQAITPSTTAIVHTSHDRGRSERFVRDVKGPDSKLQSYDPTTAPS